MTHQSKKVRACASTSKNFTLTLGNPKNIKQNYGSDQNLGSKQIQGNQAPDIEEHADFYAKAVTYLYQHNDHKRQIKNMLSKPFLLDDAPIRIECMQVMLPQMKRKQLILRALQVLFNEHINPAYQKLQAQETITKEQHAQTQAYFRDAVIQVLDKTEVRLDDLQYQNLNLKFSQHLNPNAYSKAFQVLYTFALSDELQKEKKYFQESDWLKKSQLQAFFESEIESKPELKNAKALKKHLPQFIDNLSKVIVWQDGLANTFRDKNAKKSTWDRLNSLHPIQLDNIHEIKAENRSVSISQEKVAELSSLYIETCQDKKLDKKHIDTLFKQIAVQWLKPTKPFIKAGHLKPVSRNNTLMRLGGVAKKGSRSLPNLFKRNHAHQNRAVSHSVSSPNGFKVK